MGRGNVYVGGDYEGLYYVDNDHLLVYRHKNGEEDSRLLKDIPYGEIDTVWIYDEWDTTLQIEDLEECFCDQFKKRFSSFERCGSRHWLTNSSRAVLENRLFYIALEDNEWSMAVELIQKEDYYHPIEGLQARHYRGYLDGIRDVLLDIYGEVCVRTGAWTSGTIRKEDAA